MSDLRDKFRSAIEENTTVEYFRDSFFVGGIDKAVDAVLEVIGDQLAKIMHEEIQRELEKDLI